MMFWIYLKVHSILYVYYEHIICIVIYSTIRRNKILFNTQCFIEHVLVLYTHEKPHNEFKGEKNKKQQPSVAN